MVKSRAGRLRVLDEEVLSKTPPEELEDEYDAVCGYEDAVIAAISSTEERLTSSPAPSVASVGSASPHALVCLPRLRLPDFA